MDTISRESNTSILPIAGVIAGLLGLILAGVALAKLSTASKEIAALRDENTQRISSIEGQVTTATQAAEGARRYATQLESQVNSAFAQVSDQLGTLRGEFTVLKESLTKPKAAVAGAAKGGAPKEPVVAGPGEYVVKKGDYGAKIAKAHGSSLADLQAVNPGVDLSKVQIGQKLKLPQK